MMGSEKKRARDRERMKRIRAETASRLSGMTWRDIESAPKDGTTVLLYCPKGDGSPDSTYRVTAGSWDDGYEDDPFEWWLTLDGGFSYDTMMPTHWMPMPPPLSPKERTENE